MAREQTQPAYALKAIEAFQNIMSGKQMDMVESINRCNNGELFVLQFLAMRSGSPVLPSELSAALQASMARISALLGALEKKGQLVREIDRTNRRNILVTITEAGNARVQAEMADLHERMAGIFVDMGEVDTADFIRLTRRFIELGQKHMKSESI